MEAGNYNAETAWDYLGSGLFSGRGAYDYSAQPRYKQIFESISQKPLRGQSQFGEEDILSASVGRFGNTRALLGNLSNSQLTQQLLNGSLFNLADSMGTYPEYVVQDALAGKYRRVI